MEIQQTPYEALGSETGVRELVERFYDIMDARPEVKGTSYN